MRKVTIGLVVLGVLALAFISMPMRAQKSNISISRISPGVLASRNLASGEAATIASSANQIRQGQQCNPKQIHRGAER